MTHGFSEPLNLFYDEPDPDRWVRFDRFPRRALRRIVRGVPRPGGQQRVFLNLCAGLDLLGVRYRTNDYRHCLRNIDETACIIGKPHVLDKISWRNPIIFGAAVFSHPLDDLDLLRRRPVRKILVPGEWMRLMFEPSFGDSVVSWPVGIDTDRWRPSELSKRYDFLLYDKVRWRHDEFERLLIQPIRVELGRRGLTFREIRYGFYREEDYHAALASCRAMIFLCEHETQGIAYQQALAAGVPILAWDRGGYWQDPAFYPHKVRFRPVTSVPYWDDRCGLRFVGMNDFEAQLDDFVARRETQRFLPRDYILENLTLEASAKRYLDLYRSV